jgi:hypothetical protein
LPEVSALVPLPMRCRFLSLLLVAASLLTFPLSQARAILFASTGDPGFNLTAPTGPYAGSGWDLQGSWMNDFLGTPIAPQYFVTAQHLGGAKGTPFVFQNQTYITDEYFDDPSSDPVSGLLSDLRIWHVTTPFPTYAPLYVSGNELGKPLVVFGRGKRRGSEVTNNSSVAGWSWGTSDNVMRWGTNDVSAIRSGLAGTNNLLAAQFNLGTGNPNEAALAVGDSGGAVFIKDTDGFWKLAGINFAVSGPYYTDVLGNGRFEASLYDQTGFFVENTPGIFVPALGPGEFYASRISARQDFIRSITGVPEPATTALMFGAFLFLGTRRPAATARRRP